MGSSPFLHLFHNARLTYLHLRYPALRKAHPCPACHTDAKFLDAVDLSKSCMEIAGLVLPRRGIQVNYYLCGQCGFCFAPQFHAWSFEDFEREIYNAGYAVVDPDYQKKRPMANAEWVDGLLGREKSRIRHLDYGGGSGLLSMILRQKGWSSCSYDPFVDRELTVTELGTFDLVTAFEVFEHVPDIDTLFANLGRLCKPDGLILFSTLLSDGSLSPKGALNWWYASPRNGHISLFSAQSLSLCLQRESFNLASFSPGVHLAFKQLPQWARHLISMHP